MNVGAPAGPRSRSRLSVRLRSPRWVGSSLVLVALACFLIAVAAGLISNRAASTTTTLPAASAGAGAAATGNLPTGWRDAATYVGRYQLRVIRSNPETGDVTGDLDLFLRTIKHSEPVALSGILTLHGRQGEQLVYMTDLTSAKGVLHADINGGSYFGPVIGSFVGIRHSTTLSGTVKLAGFGRLEVEMTRGATANGA